MTGSNILSSPNEAPLSGEPNEPATDDAEVADLVVSNLGLLLGRGGKITVITLEDGGLEIDFEPQTPAS